MNNVISLINAAVLAGTPLLLAALGEILTQKSGQTNLGVEGMMFLGAVASIASAYYYEQFVFAQGDVPVGWIVALIALLCSFLAGAFGAFIFGSLTITLKANQTVTGLAITMLGTGVANFFGELMGLRSGSGSGFVAVSNVTKSAFSSLSPDKVDSNRSPLFSIINRLFFNYNWVVYFAIVVAIVIGWFLNRTRVGLNLRATGENPATADAGGVNVTLYKYLATMIGGGLAGVGGMYIAMVTSSGVWNNNCVSGNGWLAVALVIFATWSPLRIIYIAYFVGGLSIARLYIPIPWLPMQIYDMAPYLATIIVLILTSLRQIKEHSQPKSCGTNYFREDR